MKGLFSLPALRELTTHLGHSQEMSTEKPPSGLLTGLG